MEQEKHLEFLKSKENHKSFLIKTINLMYVLIFLSVALAVFFYTISVGTELFVVGVMLVMAVIGALVATDAKKQIAELDDFALFYGLNKIKNEKQK